MLRKIVWVVVIALSVGLFSCSAMFEQDYVSSNVKNLPVIKYMKDGKGLCYAYTSSVTSHTYVVYSISNVPCEKVEL